MQYFLDKLKEFEKVVIVYLTFLLCKYNRNYYERNVIQVFALTANGTKFDQTIVRKNIVFFFNRM